MIHFKTLKREHNYLTADTYRGGSGHGCDMSFTPVVRAQQVAKAARASPGGRIVRLHVHGRAANCAIIPGA
jgi:hypothetical protein